MTDYLIVAEGFAMACGVLMAGIAGLLWRHHAMRPAWGLRWFAAAMALAAVTDLLSPLLISGLWRDGVAVPSSPFVRLLALMVGFGSLAALVVGTRHYVLRPARRPWGLFLALWLASQAVVLDGATQWNVPLIGDLIAAGFFLYVAWLALGAARREPGVGHVLLGLVFLAQPVALVVLAALGLDLRAARYFSAVPYAMAGLVLLSVCLVRIYSELSSELRAHSQAEQDLLAAKAALEQSHAVHLALVQQAPVPMSYSPLVDGLNAQSFWNHAWYATFGHPEGSKEGTPGSAFGLWKDPELRRRFTEELHLKRWVGPFEARLEDASGAERLCEMYGSLIDSGDGHFGMITYIDITAQRANELHLREFEAMVQSADDGILFVDQGVFTAANAGAERMFGAPAHVLVGKSPVELSPAVQADGRPSHEVARSLIEATLSGETQRFHWLHCRANGELFTAQISLTPVHGVPGRLAAVLRDVTEDLARADALARSEARLKTIIAVSNTGAWEFHGGSSYQWCSPEYFTMLGRDPSNYPMDGCANLKEVWLDLLHPDDAQTSTDRFAQYLRGDSAGLYESLFRLRHADGHWVWIWSRGQSLRNGDGSVADVTVGVHIDMTERKLAEDRLRASQTLLQATFDLLPEPLAQIDTATGRYLDVNRMWVASLGIAREHAIGRTTTELGLWFNPDDRTAVRDKLEATGRIDAEPVVYRHPSGAAIHCEVSAVAIHLGEQRIGLWLTHDVTRRKQTEAQLLKARQMSETIARAQLQFIVQKDRRQSFNGLLQDILGLVDSEYGFIGEVLRDPQGQPYLKTFAITNIAWNDATRAFYEANAPKGMEFTNLKTLFGAVLVTGEPVIANDPGHDPRRGGLPEGHPALKAFLGVPVFHGDALVAMFGISNRPGGYDDSVIDYLRPLTATIGQLVVAHRNQLRQQETELRLESISNNLPNSMVYQVDCGEDGVTRRFTYLSAGVEHLHGLARGDVLRDASLLYAQIHPQDLPLLAQKESECTQSMSEFNIEYRGRGPGGEERWFYLASTPSRNADHHIVWDGIELDITERKRAEADLALSQTQLKANLDNTPTVAVQWFDREGKVLYWNPASEVLYGVPAAEVLGRVPLGTMYANEIELQGLLDVIREIEISGKPYGPYEVGITRRDGRVVWVLATTFPIPLTEGQTAFVCMDVDITARKQAERDLQELNQTLESRVQARTWDLTQALNDLNRTQQELVQSEKLAALGALVAGVAHELNTPIGNAVTVSSTLVDAHASIREKMSKGLTRAALNDFLDTVGEAGAMLSRNLVRAADLVSSFKQVAVDQSNHQRRLFALAEIFSEMQIIMAPSLRKSHVTMNLEWEENLTLDSFPGALTQVLMILINNAITHAFEGRDQGKITLTASAEEAERVRIEVRDDGVGIAPTNLARVFEPFFTTKLGKGGSGLGMHICFNIVTATLGGKVSAHSTPGEGTCIAIDLPRTAPQPSKPTHGSETP